MAYLDKLCFIVAVAVVKYSAAQRRINAIQVTDGAFTGVL